MFIRETMGVLRDIGGKDMAKNVIAKRKLTVFEQILIASVLLLVGLFVTAYTGGWIDAHWNTGNAQIICQSVLYVLGLIAMWLIFLDITVKHVFKY